MKVIGFLEKVWPASELAQEISDCGYWGCQYRPKHFNVWSITYFDLIEILSVEKKLWKIKNWDQSDPIWCLFLEAFSEGLDGNTKNAKIQDFNVPFGCTYIFLALFNKIFKIFISFRTLLIPWSFLYDRKSQRYFWWPFILKASPFAKIMETHF